MYNYIIIHFTKGNYISEWHKAILLTWGGIKLIIVPKLGESNVSLSKELLSVVGSKVEIQMTTKDLKLSLSRCNEVITNLLKYKKINEVVLHMPFSLHVFEVFVASQSHRDNLLNFIKDVEDLSAEYNIQIGLLLHQESSTELIESIDPYYETIKSILNSIKSDRVYFLVENCLPCLNAYDVRKIPAFDILEKVQHEKLFSCIDLCHIRCYENIFRTTLEIPEDIAKRVKWVHFAYTSKHDGYVDKSTHGIKHPGLQSMYMDLEYLIWNNIDLSITPIVAEISERDYTLCPDMLEEIGMLTVLDAHSNFVHSKLSPRRNIG